MVVLGLRFCARAFSSWGKWGPLFITVRGPLTIAASLVAEHRLQTRRLSNCGSQAQLLRGMWDPPRPGLEPVSPALAGRLSTTAPPGKPLNLLMFQLFSFLAGNSWAWSNLATIGRRCMVELCSSYYRLREHLTSRQGRGRTGISLSTFWLEPGVKFKARTRQAREGDRGMLLRALGKGPSHQGFGSA